MEEIVVTFQAAPQVMKELKIPVFVTSRELLVMLSEALNLPNIGPERRLQAEPLGRILQPDRTLQEEGVAHGALLTLIS